MKTENFPIIGFGASAGGLEPLEKIFSKLPESSDYAYVIIQHLAPNHKSLMDELLARHTDIPIVIIEDDLEIKKKHIYLNPPKCFVSIEEGRFRLKEKEDRKLSFPISYFLKSLADYNNEYSVGVILSGTGSDGAEGIKYIKEKGGLILAQNPEESKFDGMPKNAIKTGIVDKVCNVDEIFNEIRLFYKSYIYYNKQVLNPDKNEKIKEIVRIIKNKIHVDFTNYKLSTITRRINRRVGVLGVRTLDEYIKSLKNNISECHLLSKELLINVTRFFRDEEAFEKLNEIVIPDLFEKNKDTKTIRVWVPACSTGEEAYTIAILINDYQRRNELFYDVTIFATDLDNEAIKMAINPFFSSNIVNEIPNKYINSYFTPQKKGFVIAKEIREMIVFSVHNLIQDPPFSKIDLVSCRNFLIYLNSEAQQNVFNLFQYSLKENGYLFLGSSESLGEMASSFKEVDKKYKIFYNYKRNIKVPFKNFNSKVRESNLRETKDKPLVVEKYSFKNSNRLISTIQESLIQAYAPDCLVFSDDFTLLHTTGRVNEWLSIPRGEVSANVLKMLPEQLEMPFELMSNKVLNTGNPVSLSNIKLEGKLKEVYKDADSISIYLKILSVNNGNNLISALVKGFYKNDEQRDENESEVNLNIASQEKVDILERELRVNKENLQTTIEELESSNEELQAANEELQSSNEELESVNEELYTVNSEFQEKVNELSDSNNDLNNLIHSTNIAILFLDSSLHIRKFTPAIKSILNLVKHDVGRHISHFRSKFQLDEIVSKIEDVQDYLIPKEIALNDLKGKDYILRITPFKTVKNEIKGVVLTFIDITGNNKILTKLQTSEKELSNISEKLEKQSELFELITNNSNDMIGLFNLDREIEYMSPVSERFLNKGNEDLIGEKFDDFIKEKEARYKWENTFEKLKKGELTSSLRYQIKSKGDTQRWLETNFRPVNNQSGQIVKILTSTRDITQRYFIEEEIKRLSLITEQTTNAIIVADVEGRITFCNPAFEKLSGYEENEVLGLKPGSFLQGDETQKNVVEEMGKAIKEKKPFDVELINYNKSREKYWVRVKCEPMFNDNEQHIGFFSLQYDISREKEYDEQILALTNSLKVSNEKLTSINKSLEEFAFIVSHDLKAPVKNLIGMVNLFQKNWNNMSDSKINKYLEVIEDSAKKMNNLIESLLDYSKSGVVSEKLISVNTYELLDSVKGIYKNQLSEVNGKVKINTEIESIKVYPILFKRLLNNLLDNAIKYSKENEDLLVQIDIIDKDKDFIKFKFCDNGIGIKEEFQETIFRIFYSLKPRKDSTGIGLAICKKIVELHGGDIKIISKENEGTCFEFTIKKNIEG